jgi:hypothetical protein
MLYGPFCSSLALDMTALNTFAPKLAAALWMSPAKATDRQQMLTEAGILKARPGRGPGSGVELNPRNVSLVLIALLIGDFHQHPLSSVSKVANARSFAQFPTYFPKHKTLFADTVKRPVKFIDALSTIIERGFAVNEPLAAMLVSGGIWPDVELDRHSLEARMHVIWDCGTSIGKPVPTSFLPALPAPEHSQISVRATIAGGALRSIHDALRETLSR